MCETEFRDLEKTGKGIRELEKGDQRIRERGSEN